MRITGRCEEGDPFAALASPITGLVVPDGEVRIELRPVSGAERMLFGIRYRTQADQQSSYLTVIDPVGRGVLTLKEANGQSTRLNQPLIGPAQDPSADGWIPLAVRMQGPRLWAMLGDQPVLLASDATFEEGGVLFQLIRVGNPDESVEASVLLRNLRISNLVPAP
jgi:hypothetical protein